MTVLMFRHLQTCWCNCMIILQNAERCFSTHNYTIVHSDKHISKAFKLIIKPSLLRCVRFKAGLSACVRETEVFMLLRNTIKPHNKNNVFGHEEADGLDESSPFFSTSPCSGRGLGRNTRGFAAKERVTGVGRSHQMQHREICFGLRDVWMLLRTGWSRLAQRQGRLVSFRSWKMKYNPVGSVCIIAGHLMCTTM